MVFGGLDIEIDEARTAYRDLRGYLADDVERNALDGVFNEIKAPLRLLIDEPSASVDQQCEALAQMLASLHRLFDLLTTLKQRYSRRTGVGSHQVDSALHELETSPSFIYLDHFTSAVKHAGYVPRGLVNGVSYIDAFEYRDRSGGAHEPRRTCTELVEDARVVIRLASRVMLSMIQCLSGSRTFDPSQSYVCATPTHDPNLYTVARDGPEESPEPVEQAHQPGAHRAR